MDFRTIRAVINANADKSLSASARLVIVALAVCMYKEGAQCKATVKELARMCNMTPRTVISVIGTLKAAGVVRVIANGTANSYELNGENISPSGGVYIGREVKEKECEKSRAHTRVRDFEELTEAEAIAAGKLAGVSQDVARQVFGDMKANGGGYIARGVFVKVTSENLQAAIRTMSKHAKPTTENKSAKQARKFTAKDWELCAERCRYAKAGGGCLRGVIVPPACADRPHPPQECNRFKPLPDSPARA